MHRSESYDCVQCGRCGAEVSVSRDRTYAFGEDLVLCYGCSVGLGGRYDDLHDRWDRAPSLATVKVERPS